MVVIVISQEQMQNSETDTRYVYIAIQQSD